MYLHFFFPQSQKRKKNDYRKKLIEALYFVWFCTAAMKICLIKRKCCAVDFCNCGNLHHEVRSSFNF